MKQKTRLKNFGNIGIGRYIGDEWLIYWSAHE